MAYCTNCGKESSKRVCPHCGVKAGKTHHFCAWCGTELDEHSEVCPNCKERVRPRKIGMIVSLLFILLFVFLAEYSLAFEKNGTTNYLALFIAAVGVLLWLPPVKQLLMKITHDKRKLRPILNIARVVLCFALVVAMSSAMEGSKSKFVQSPTEVAVEIFHQEVTLKNEDSFVLNDSHVTTEKWSNGRYFITVVLDYSAQNGFGGMNRDTYTVTLIYDENTQQYTRYH